MMAIAPGSMKAEDEGVGDESKVKEVTVASARLVESSAPTKEV